jgi:hypothetical protein
MISNPINNKKVVAIHQPNFIPWLGFFYKIYKSDIFVLLDNVQFPKESAAARNYIKGKNGSKVLLSVSVKKSEGSFQNYNEIELDYSSKWNIKHLNQIKDAYIKSSYFNLYFPEFESILKTKFYTLAELNIAIIKWVLKHLEITTQVEIASQFDGGGFGRKNNRNLNICLHFGANSYLSGIGAKQYNDESLYEENKVELLYSDYKPATYPQINGNEFLPNLSVLDALFNCGSETAVLLKKES